MHMNGEVCKLLSRTICCKILTFYVVQILSWPVSCNKDLALVAQAFAKLERPNEVFANVPSLKTAVFFAASESPICLSFHVSFIFFSNVTT